MSHIFVSVDMQPLSTACLDAIKLMSKIPFVDFKRTEIKHNVSLIDNNHTSKDANAGS